MHRREIEFLGLIILVPLDVYVFFFLLPACFPLVPFLMLTGLIKFNPGNTFVIFETIYHISSNNSRPLINCLPGIITFLEGKYLK